MISSEMLTKNEAPPCETVGKAGFLPVEPQSLKAAGLSNGLVESLVCKYLHAAGTMNGRELSQHLCLPFGIVDQVCRDLRRRQIVVHVGAAAMSDYLYALTDHGRLRTQSYLESCAYLGPAPVPLKQYIDSVYAQTIRSQNVSREQLREAFRDVLVDRDTLESIGPAINSGTGLFLYGNPGNGKSTIAKRITMCFGQQIWIPQALIEDGQIIKLYDGMYHQAVEDVSQNLMRSLHCDRRWVRIRRPTVIVGGELTLDSLEMRHNLQSNVCEAPLQLKSNGGCLLIDDFGRQQVKPADLLNRWIVPLENQVDYLTLPTGKKIQVPFEQLLLFSTNLEPSYLVDEAFLRRISYKIKIEDPSEVEFHKLVELNCRLLGCEYRRESVDYLLRAHFDGKRSMRRCHPRDLLHHVRSYCAYHGLLMELRPEYLDRVVESYFTAV